MGGRRKVASGETAARLAASLESRKRKEVKLRGAGTAQSGVHETHKLHEGIRADFVPAVPGFTFKIAPDVSHSFCFMNTTILFAESLEACP
jgi:hypothetical protein